MGYQVIIGRVAERDLAEIYHYIARDNPDSARSFISKLMEEAHFLETLPNRGGHFSERRGTRFTILGRYLIIYRVNENKKEVLILRFWHTARERRR